MSLLGLYPKGGNELKYKGHINRNTLCKFVYNSKEKLKHLYGSIK